MKEFFFVFLVTERLWMDKCLRLSLQNAQNTSIEVRSIDIECNEFYTVHDLRDFGWTEEGF